MSWVKIDDAFPEHEKVPGISDAAFRLNVSALCWSSRRLTDGRIPAAVLGLLLPPQSLLALAEYLRLPAMSLEDVASELVDAGLWERDGDNYQIHDYLEYQPSRETVLARRDSDARRKGLRPRSGRSPSGVLVDEDRIPSAPGPGPLSASLSPDLDPPARAIPVPVPVPVATRCDLTPPRGTRPADDASTIQAVGAILPELGADLVGLVSSWLDAFPGLDLVRLAHEARSAAQGKRRTPDGTFMHWFLKNEWERQRAARAAEEREAAASPVDGSRRPERQIWTPPPKPAQPADMSNALAELAKRREQNRG